MMKPTLFIVVFAMLLSPAGSPAAAPAAKPNIVIFIADDLTWHDVACFGGAADAKTPNLDRLASEGGRLTGFFPSAAGCALAACHAGSPCRTPKWVKLFECLSAPGKSEDPDK
jgi:hypothetical protein